MQPILFLASIALMFVIVHSAQDEAAARKAIMDKISSIQSATGGTGQGRAGESSMRIGGSWPPVVRPTCDPTTKLWNCFHGFTGCRKMCKGFEFFGQKSCYNTCWSLFTGCMASVMSSCDDIWPPMF